MAQPVEFITPSTDGDFLSVDKWDVDKKSRKKKVDTIDDIRFYRQRYTMNDGTRYNVFSSVVPDEKKRTNISSLETSGWLTSPNGMNRRRQINLGKLGMETTFVGVQQNFWKIGNFEASAHHQLAIGKSSANEFDRDTELFYMNGISRGAMIGLGATALAWQHGMDIVYNDAIVPCFPDGLNLHRDAKEIPGILTGLRNEINPIKSIKDIPLPALQHFPQTADTSGIFQQIKEVPSLLSGKVGELIDDNMSHEQFQYLTVFSGDMLSQGRRWQDRFDPDKYAQTVVNSTEGGGHISCVTPTSHEGWYGRWDTIIPIVADSADALRTLTPEKRSKVVYELAKAANPIFDRASFSLTA